MKKFLIYQHAGSLNHGCEALATMVSSEIKRVFPGAEVNLRSHAPEEDHIDSIDKVLLHKGLIKWTVPHIVFQVDKRLFPLGKIKDIILADRKMSAMAHQYDGLVAIGGDNYCYSKGKSEWPTDIAIKNKDKKMMLWGASIEPKDLPGELTEHLKNFNIITARESITFNALVENGLGDRVHLVADPAFLLEAEYLTLPENWKENQMVGINLSPLILNYSKNKTVVKESIKRLVEYIISETEMNVVLVPHVLHATTNDLSVLKPIYEKFKTTGRVLLLDDQTLTCKQLKGYISRCRFFIGARTHSIVAAYSSGVPAIALGYSVKAKGIARDLFGSEDNLVLPVQTFDDPSLAVNAIKYLFENEDAIKDIYNERLPSYIENAKKSAQLFADLINGD